MTASADVVIIGGGISGLALAYELSRRRRQRIVILERRHVGYGATSRNIGRVRTSQFNEALAVLAKAAFRKHRRLSRELGRNTLFWTPGYALVFYDDEEIASIETIRAMLHGLGQTTEFHREHAVFDRLPVLRGGEMPVGCLIRPDASVHHDALLNAYKRAVLAAGVEIREFTEVHEIRSEAGRVTGVQAGDRFIRSDLVVNAAGGWSREISARAGIRTPNAPIRREAIVTEAARPYMRTMITFYRSVEGWFHQTLRGETVIGITDPDEPLGINHAASAEHMRRAANLLLAKAPQVAGLRAVRQWAGVYDMTPDRKPLIGPSNALPGLVQLNGDNGRGIALVPYLAELLAEWLETGARPPLLADFDANRFDGREDEQVIMGDYYAAYKTSPGKDG